RRVIRRVMVYARQLGLHDNWLAGFIKEFINIYSDAYPELESKSVLISINDEMERFIATLDKGIKEIKGQVTKAGYVTGSQASVYYQSYGIPLDVTTEIVNGMDGEIKDLQDFDKEMEKHQDLSRTASAGVFKGGLADHTEEVVRLHTATHLMNAALRQVLGEHVWQKGSNITKERTRFDFTHSEKMTDEQKSKVEELVNSWIERDLTVKKEVMPLEQAKQLNAIGVFGEKYAETVSVYTVMDPKNGEVISREFCGGPHVEHTGVIGQFKILKEEAVAAGIRRIKAAVS
ncbi:MAG: Alanine-tRNA ligase, partial [Parcubacteria group bacterium GW2011_GWE1_43_8]